MLRILSALCLSMTVAATAGAAVRTQAGEVAGVQADGLMIFKGIPYAAPPLGDLRWRPPEPAARWAGVKRARAFAPACMQSGVSMPGETPPRTSEDCLYLNLWIPANLAKGRLAMEEEGEAQEGSSG